MAFAGLDLIVRLLVIERKDAIRWGVDPAADPNEAKKRNPTSYSQASLTPERIQKSVELLTLPVRADSRAADESGIDINRAPAGNTPQQTLTPLDVLSRLLASPRAMVCVFSTFIYG